MKKVKIEFITRTTAEDNEKILGKIREYILSWNTSSVMTRDGLKEVKYADGLRIELEELQ